MKQSVTYKVSQSGGFNIYDSPQIVTRTFFGGSSQNRSADVASDVTNQPKYTLLQLDTKNAPSLINHNSAIILGANNNSIISNTHNEKNNSVKSIAMKKLLTSISVAKNPISVGNDQTITFTVSSIKSDKKINKADINASVTYASNTTTLEFEGTTNKTGQVSFTWTIGGSSNTGMYVIKMLASATGYEPQFQTKTFEVIASENKNITKYPNIDTNNNGNIYPQITTNRNGNFSDILGDNNKFISNVTSDTTSTLSNSTSSADYPTAVHKQFEQTYNNLLSALGENASRINDTIYGNENNTLTTTDNSDLTDESVNHRNAGGLCGVLNIC